MDSKRFVVRPGVKVYYELYNENKTKVVVLIHGFGVNNTMWGNQLKALSDYKIINVDVRAHGLSRPCDKFDVVLAANDIAAILTQENCLSASIVGLSMGSYVAQEFARCYETMTDGLFLADGTPIFMKYPLWEKLSLKYSTPLLKLYTWEGLKKTMAKQTALKPEVQKQLYEMFSQMRRDEFMVSWKGMTNTLHEEDLKLQCPLYFVYGQKDTAGTIKMHVKDWSRLYPACKVREIETAGHLSNMDNPEQFNVYLLEFLNEVAVFG